MRGNSATDRNRRSGASCRMKLPTVGRVGEPHACLGVAHVRVYQSDRTDAGCPTQAVGSVRLMAWTRGATNVRLATASAAHLGTIPVWSIHCFRRLLRRTVPLVG